MKSIFPKTIILITFLFILIHNLQTTKFNQTPTNILTSQQYHNKPNPSLNHHHDQNSKILQSNSNKSMDNLIQQQSIHTFSELSLSTTKIHSQSQKDQLQLINSSSKQLFNNKNSLRSQSYLSQNNGGNNQNQSSNRYLTQNTSQPNCLHYDQKNMCTQCKEHYALTVYNTCQKCPLNCLNCQYNDQFKTTYCSQCDKSSQYFILVNSNCYKYASYQPYQQKLVLQAQNISTHIILSCPYSCKQCKINDGTLYCSILKYGYGFVQQNNSLSSTAICANNCKQCSNDTYHICNKCSNGYLLDGNACYNRPRSIEHCQSSYLHTNINGNTIACDTCEDEYYLQSSFVFVGYFAYTTSCKKCYLNCKSCENTTNCSVCKPGYTVYFNSLYQYQECVLCKQGCSTCGIVNDKNNSDTKNQMICTSCFPGYFLYNGQCVGCSQNCKVCTYDQCLTCYPGYIKRLSTDIKCIQQIKYCQQYSQQGSCIQCIYNYNLTQNQCKYNQYLTIGYDNNRLACNSQYQYLYNYQCLNATNLIQNCIEYHLSGCLQCKVGHYLQYKIPHSNQYCNKCSQNCSSCIINQDVCTDCVDGYYLNTQTSKCIKCDANCLTCDQKPFYCLSCAGSNLVLTSSRTCVYKQKFNVKVQLVYSFTSIHQIVNEIKSLCQSFKYKINVSTPMVIGEVDIRTYYQVCSLTNIYQSPDHANHSIIEGYFAFPFLEPLNTVFIENMKQNNLSQNISIFSYSSDYLTQNTSCPFGYQFKYTTNQCQLIRAEFCRQYSLVQTQNNCLNCQYMANQNNYTICEISNNKSYGVDYCRTYNYTLKCLQCQLTYYLVESDNICKPCNINNCTICRQQVISLNTIILCLEFNSLLFVILRFFQIKIQLFILFYSFLLNKLMNIFFIFFITPFIKLKKLNFNENIYNYFEQILINILHSLFYFIKQKQILHNIIFILVVYDITRYQCYECKTIIQNNITLKYKIINNICSYQKLQNIVNTDVYKILLGDYAIKCIIGCIQCDNPYTCLTCRLGYHVYPTYQGNICKKNQNNCMTQRIAMNDSNICQNCYSGFALIYNSVKMICQACQDKYCLSCLESNFNICNHCSSGKYVSQQGKCASCKQNCQRCFNGSDCQQCKSGYTEMYSNQTKQNYCIKCIQGCAYCNYNGCVRCYNRFFINENKVCQRCSDKCWSCLSLSNCYKCEIGYTLIDRKCMLQIQNCYIHSNNTTCSKCYFGYQLSSDSLKCIRISTTNISDIYQAITQSTKQNSTTTCLLYNFLEFSNECIKCEYNDSSLNNLLNNCLQCRSSVYCTKCQKGYYLSSQIDEVSVHQCKKCQIGCQQCYSNNICKICSSGYFMSIQFYDPRNYVTIMSTADINNTPSIMSTSQSNNEDKTLGTQEKIGYCSKCVSNCLTCYEQQNYCTSCQQGYYLSKSLSCIQLNRFALIIRLNLQIKLFYAKTNLFIKQLSTLLNISSQSIKLTNITEGSTIINAILSANSYDSIINVKQTFIDNANIGSSIIGSQILSISMSSITNSSSSNDNYTSYPIDNKPPVTTPIIPDQTQEPIVITCYQFPILAVILSVVGGLILIVGVIVIYCCCCGNKANNQQGDQINSQSGKSINPIQSQSNIPNRQSSPQRSPYFDNLNDNNVNNNNFDQKINNLDQKINQSLDIYNRNKQYDIIQQSINIQSNIQSKQLSQVKQMKQTNKSKLKVNTQGHI